MQTIVTICIATVKNLFGTQGLFISNLRCVFTSLIDKTNPVNNTQLFLKLSDFDQDRLVAKNSIHTKKESVINENA
jgi:hypothetical protein